MRNLISIFTLCAALLFGGRAQAQILAPILYGLGASGGDSLTYSLSHNTTNITTNLTTVTSPGTDWYAMGGVNGSSSCPGVNHKSSGGSVIGGYTLVGGATMGGVSFYLNNGIGWTDGTPTGSNSESGGSGQGCPPNANTAGYGMSFTCPASTVAHQCILYVSVYNGTVMNVNAHLSDDSGHVHDINDSESSPSSGQWYTYTFNYQAGSSGQTLTLTVTNGTGSSGAFFIQAVAYI